MRALSLGWITLDT